MTTELDIHFEMTKYDNCKDTLFDVKSGFHLFAIYLYIYSVENNKFDDNIFIHNKDNHIKIIKFAKNEWDDFTNNEKKLWENLRSKCYKINKINNTYTRILVQCKEIIRKIDEDRRYNSYEGILSRKLGKVNNLIERINQLNSYGVFSDDEYYHREWEIEDLHGQLSEAKNDLYSFYSS